MRRESRARFRPISTMKITLFAFSQRPNAVAISKTKHVLAERSFYLDFSRPIQYDRWLVVRNRMVGFKVAAIVPIVHATEQVGQYVAIVLRSDPYFKDIENMWETRFPSENPQPLPGGDALDVIADFANHFPEGC
jgi:hypothetical protein